MATMLVTAGCLGSAGPTSETSLEPATANESPEANGTWEQAGNVSLGWVAAAGAHSFAGDSIVGVRSHDQCPSVSFVVPEAADQVQITFEPSVVGSGVGTYTVAISSPEAVTYLSPPASEPEFTEEAPPAGPWAIELKPRGATVNQVWPFEVTFEGNGTAPDQVELVKDRDCLL